MLAQIDTYLRAMFGDLGPVVGVGLLGLALVVLALPFLLVSRPDPLDRLKPDAPGPNRESARPSLRQEQAPVMGPRGALHLRDAAGGGRHRGRIQVGFRG